MVRGTHTKEGRLKSFSETINEAKKKPIDTLDKQVLSYMKKHDYKYGVWSAAGYKELLEAMPVDKLKEIAKDQDIEDEINFSRPKQAAEEIWDLVFDPIGDDFDELDSMVYSYGMLEYAYKNSRNNSFKGMEIHKYW